MELAGCVVLITGGACGLGSAYTEELLKHGTRVAICDMNGVEGEKMASSLTAKHGKDRVIFCQCDVTDYGQFEDSFHTTIETFGHIDVVINNAGIMNDKFWELAVDINLNGVIRGMLLAQRFMGTNRGGKGGVVVNIASSLGLNPYVSLPIYSATKSAIVSLTRAFGADYHVNLTDVRVMALCPSVANPHQGDVATTTLLSSQYEDAWQYDTASLLPLKPEDTAKALIHVLRKGNSGSVWLLESGLLQPKEIVFP